MFFQRAYYGRNSWWRWLLTIAGFMVVFVVASIPAGIFEYMEAQRLGFGEQNIDAARAQPDFNRTLNLLLMLVPFAVAFAALWFFLRVLHKKPLLFIMTGRPRFDWQRLFVGFAVWFTVIGAITFAYLPSGSYQYTFQPSLFWPQLVVILALIPLQASCEEALFRGYLTQGISLLFKNKLVTYLLVVLLFTAVHAANPEFYQDYTRGFLSYLLISLFLGAVAVLDDGLELACGIHIANNIFATSVLSIRDGSFLVDSLFQTDLATLYKLPLMLDLGTYAVGFSILFLIYKWRWSTFFESPKPAPAPEDAPIA